MKIHRKLSFSRPKIWIIAIIIGLLLTVGWWVAASVQWQQVANSASRASGHADKLQQEVVSSSGSRDSRVAAVHSLADLKPISCDADWWIGWQLQVWGGSKEARDDCQAAKSKVDNLVARARSLDMFLTDEKVIISHLSALEIDSKAKDWQTRAATASTGTYKQLLALKMDKEAAAVLYEATKRVKGVRDAWKALSTANSKKDRTAYESALSRLDDAYMQLASITEVSDKQLNALVSSLKITK